MKSNLCARIAIVTENSCLISLVSHDVNYLCGGVEQQQHILEICFVLRPKSTLLLLLVNLEGFFFKKLEPCAFNHYLSPIILNVSTTLTDSSPPACNGYYLYRERQVPLVFLPERKATAPKMCISKKQTGDPKAICS
jgi:hypothetical protein